MSGNVRTLNDVEQPSRAQQYEVREAFEIQNPQATGGFADSRFAKFWTNCWFLFFPNFSVRTVTFVYACILIFVFLVTQIVYASSGFSWTCVLYYSGAKFTYAITRKGHLHRLFLPIILHTSFFHIFWNLLSLFMIGFSIEKALGSWRKYVALIILGGIGANVISGVIDPYSLTLGASTSLFAIIGAVLVWFCINWSNLGPMRVQYVIFLGIIVMFAFLNGFLFRGSDLDNWGHFGGLIYGTMLALFFFHLNPTTEVVLAKKERRIRVYTLISIAIVTVVFVVALFARPLPGCDALNCANFC